MREIKEFKDIDYLTSPEGRLLFAAITILIVNDYPNKTPDEVIDIVRKKADSFLPKISK